MNIVDKAFQTQLTNIQAKTGKSLDELKEIVRTSGLTKHGEIRDMLKRDVGLGHGDANTLTHYCLESRREVADTPAEESLDDIVAQIYAGPKAALLPIHEKIMAAITTVVGPYETSPKKTYLSLRRKKQFAMVGPATNTRIEVGLNMKDVASTDRLVAEKPGGMCQYKVKVTDASEVDDELIGWIKQAYDGAN